MALYATEQYVYSFQQMFHKTYNKSNHILVMTNSAWPEISQNKI